MGPLIRIRVPGDGHENSLYRPRRHAVVCCPCVRDGRGHDSPVAHALVALTEERKVARSGVKQALQTSKSGRSNMRCGRLACLKIFSCSTETYALVELSL